MPRVCLLNYFFETTSFSFGWSDDQLLTLDTTTSVICRELKPTFEDPSTAGHPSSRLWPPTYFISPHWAVPSSNINSFGSAHFMLCAFAQTFLFFLPPPSQIVHLVKVFKFQLELSFFVLLLCLVCTPIFLPPFLDPEILEVRCNLFFIFTTGTFSLFLLPHVTPFFKLQS